MDSSQNKKYNKSKRHLFGGFTLIELLVVISIIGMLASIIMVGLDAARQRARYVKILTDMQQLRKAMQLYYEDNLTYTSGSGPINDWQAATNTLGPILSKYISQIPTPPCQYWQYTISNNSALSPTFVIVRKSAPGALITPNIARLCVSDPGLCSQINLPYPSIEEFGSKITCNE